MRTLETVRVRANHRLTDRLWWCEYDAPRLAGAAQPGQFAHVRCAPHDCYDPMLRRPLSFSRIDPARGRVAFLIDVVGRGTAWLVQRDPGSLVDVLGPLGRPFAYQPGRTRALMVGGGIGLAPLLALADRAPQAGVAVTLLSGGRDRHGLTPRGYVAPHVRYAVATDDGSEGHHGVVTELIPPMYAWADQIFACGPTAMLRALAGLTPQLAAATGVASPVFVALEARMGCGVGACYSCVVPTIRGPERVCTDGPVFAQADLTWAWGHG